MVSCKLVTTSVSNPTKELNFSFFFRTHQHNFCFLLTRFPQYINIPQIAFDEEISYLKFDSVDQIITIVFVKYQYI